MFTDNYILNPRHKVKVLLIGCGGTGSFIAPELSGLSNCLKEMDKLGLDITIMDGDSIEEHNIGRQKFSYSDIGGSKSIVLGTRINRFYGNNDVDAYCRNFVAKDLEHLSPNIIITAVDKVDIRKDIDEYLKATNGNRNNREHEQCYYWIDVGNGKDFGQVVISSYQGENKTNLKSIIDLHPNIEETTETPSCSMKASLMKQSYMINKFAGSYVIDLMSSMFIDYKIKYNALYFNLNNFKIKTKM